MISARATRLVRVDGLQAFREAVVALALDGAPLDARDRLVVVPTRAAAAHLLRTIEDARLPDAGAVVLPELITPDELIERLVARLDEPPRVLTDAEREVLLGVSCRAALRGGEAPPFRLRPGLVAEILRFYDALRRNQKDVATFERLALGMLEPGAPYDRGAERLVRQTRFLTAAFREFEQRSGEAGCDEHVLRRRLLTGPASRPWRHVVLTVADRGGDPVGLDAADWDVLARVPGLERLDVVVTERTLAGALHERMHRWLPGIEEVRFDAAPREGAPYSPFGGAPLDGAPRLYRDRDREEEVAGFARRVKRAFRRGDVSALDRVALVVHQPLPYVYLAREVLRSAGIPSQLFDALPLGAEPVSAALDLVLSCVSANFARVPALALMRSPHFTFRDREGLTPRAIDTFDRALSEAGYLGDPDALARMESITAPAATLMEIARDLAPLRQVAPAAVHLEVLAAFLTRHEAPPPADEPLRGRHLRARGAILSTLASLAAAYRRFDEEAVEFDQTAALIRRWIEAQTFAPRSGDRGVHVVDDRSAAFGEFEHVQIAGLVDGEWPDRPRRNIFYSPAILRELGWPSEADRLDAARARFADLLRLASGQLSASTFLLEADSLVSPSPFVDEIERAGLDVVEDEPGEPRVFTYEALGQDPVDLSCLGDQARSWGQLRLSAPGEDDPRFRGTTLPPAARAYSLSALERYQDCPFKYFASDILRLEEAPEDESALSPRARGRFVHEVFQRFFEAWDQRAGGTITADRLDEARDLFASVAEPLLERLPEADAALERARLFGSAIAVGIVDVVLGLEATRPAEVRERWLEYRMEGEFALGDPGRRVALKGVADRIDLLDGRRLRVIDYKTGSAPNPRRALQVAIYSLCAEEQLSARDGAPWAVEDAAYVAFSGKRSLVPVVKAGAADTREPLESARARLFGLVDAIGRGEFPPRPHDLMICRWCAYAGVCRKDYVGDD